MANRAAIRTAFILLAALSLGCDAEGYSVNVGSDAGTEEADPATGPTRGGDSLVFTGVDIQTKTAVATTPTPDAGTPIQPDTRPAVTVTVTVTTTVSPDAGMVAAPDARPADTRAPDTMPAVQPDTRIADTMAPGLDADPRDPSGGKATNDAGWNGYASGGLCPMMVVTSATDPTLRCAPMPIEPFCDPKFSKVVCIPATEYVHCLKACP
jgi:hypothetical protein